MTGTNSKKFAVTESTLYWTMNAQERFMRFILCVDKLLIQRSIWHRKKEQNEHRQTVFSI